MMIIFWKITYDKERGFWHSKTRRGGGVLVFIVTTAEALDYIILASTRDQLWESLFIRFQILIRIARSSFLPEP